MVDEGRERMLLTVASRIDSGQPIDWTATEREARTPADREVVSQLRVLARMTHVFRNPDNQDAEETATEPAAIGLMQPAASWGPLTIIDELGRGSFGTVYRARDNLNREVALKLFNKAENGGEPRFLHEARLLARLRHRNIVTVYGADRFDSRVGLWMELIRGRTLADELRNRGVFGAEEAGAIGRDLCRALAAVHEAGLIHRDIKAQNVMREVGGRILLMDFGAGVRLSQHEGSLVGIAGTPAYIAPELFASGRSSAASDLYSLGVLLYYLVTGAYPIPGSNRLEIERAHREGMRKRLRDVRPDLPDAFVQAVEHALSADPAQRCRTAGELESLLAGVPDPTTRPQGEATHAGPHRVRTWTIAAAAVLCVLMLTAAARWTALWDSIAAPRESDASAAPRPAPASDGPYAVSAEFYKVATPERVGLAAGDRVRPGDALGLRFEASTPLYVYVINQDDRGESYLLFPLKGQESLNPLAPGAHDLPGKQADREVHWQVTSAGGREHFIVFASPAEMAMFDALLRSLPQATAGRPVSQPKLPASVLSGLRGVGGVVASDSAAHQGERSYLFQLADPLRTRSETAQGLWVRQLSLENPVAEGRR